MSFWEKLRSTFVSTTSVSGKVLGEVIIPKDVAMVIAITALLITDTTMDAGTTDIAISTAVKVMAMAVHP